LANNIVEVEGLSKYFKYGKKYLRAVHNVSFTFEEGTTLGLVGESGSGKSTVARLILNLIPPTSGKVKFQGESVYDMTQNRLRE
jgi:peptide/nickel transport system ATP-binding protein